MSETIKLEYKDLGIMSEDALAFFEDEIRDGNVVSVVNPGGSTTDFKCLKEWDGFLLKGGFRKPPEKKSYRI
jgi:hypothetical protein